MRKTMSMPGSSAVTPREMLLEPSVKSRMHRGLYLLLQQMRARPVGRFMRRIAALEALPREAFREHLDRRLKDTLGLARSNVPYYASGRWRTAFRGGDAFDISSWPVLERDDLSNHFAALHARGAGILDANRRSSATTGGPVRVSMHRHAAAWQWAWEHHVMGRHGFPLGAPALVFWGGGVTPFQNWVRNRTFFSTTDLTTQRLDAAADALIEGALPAVWSYPSAAFQLARHVAHRSGRSLDIPYIKVGGEPLFGFQRTEIQRWLGGRVINFYGASEVGPVAAECPEGSLHAFSENVHLEIFHGDAPAPPEALGDIVLTPLTNPVMPLVRYRIGDRARLVDRPCACGWHRPVLVDVQARRTDMIRSGDGGEQHVSALVEGMAEIVQRASVSSLRQFTLEQHGERRWTVLVEGPDGHDPELERALKDAVRRHVGGDVAVRVRWTALIPRDHSGKFRYYRSFLPVEAKPRVAAAPATREVASSIAASASPVIEVAPPAATAAPSVVRSAAPDRAPAGVEGPGNDTSNGA